MDEKSSRPEGLACLICGDETGNTDLCVPCAMRVQDSGE